MDKASVQARQPEPVASKEQDRRMEPALKQAHEAAKIGEVPVGACLYDPDGMLIAKGCNRTIIDCDPSAHAEIICLGKAAKKLANHRLNGCTLYVTLEPCAMCVGAILHARIAQVFYGASDPKTGACGTVLDIPANLKINHQTRFVGGIKAAECGTLLQDFFKERR